MSGNCRPISRLLAASWLALVAIVLVVTIAPICAQDEHSESQNEIEITANADANPRKVLPPLFDFAYYKRVFHKKYSSWTEELVRRSYFIPRALKVVSSAVAYMFRKKTYHLALNHLSDKTPEELARMQNHHAEDDEPGLKAATSSESAVENAAKEEPRIAVTDEELRQSLDELAAEAPPSVSELLEGPTSGSRAKRSATEVGESVAEVGGEQKAPEPVESKPRKVRLGDLINLDSGETLFARLQVKAVDSVPSNNANYEPVKQSSRRIAEQLQHVNHWDLDVSPDDESQMSELKEELRRHIFPLTGGEFGERDSALETDDEKDELMVDHSQGGCMDQVRDQGDCGSCWAFAGIALYEWLYCKKHGKLVRFSEQYMVDCGRHVAAFGCEGGSVRRLANFVLNFGLELRRNYPYRARDQQCPFHKHNTDLQTTGYIRLESKNLFNITMEAWQEYLHFGPLLIDIVTVGTDFDQYGHGIHYLKGCDNPPSSFHLVLLVGYGQQDGVKYWKIRNSFSMGWGEAGYYRLARDSVECVRPYGFALATDDGLQFELEHFNENPNYDHERIRNFYWKGDKRCQSGLCKFFAKLFQ